MRRVLILAGTRPEAIKLAPVVLEMRKSEKLEPVLCSSGQHRELLREALADFGLEPDLDLAVMREGQSLTGLAGRLFTALEKVMDDIKPAAILVQGDTTTALVGAIAGFYSKIPVGHVEAGLRSNDMSAPWPEEFNRRAAALAAAWHFAPATRARDNLLAEGVLPQNIFVTGNTVVDALEIMCRSIRENPPDLPAAAAEILRKGQPYVLVTCHRRESFGEALESIFAAIANLAGEYPEVAFIYPVHPNPRVHDLAHKCLGRLQNMALVPPCSYRAFLYLLEHCSFVMSDSGGVQEEAPSFAKRVVVMRDVTERPEGVEAGFCLLAGTEGESIAACARQAMAESAPPAAPNPFGDGRAAERIAAVIEKNLAHSAQ